MDFHHQLKGAILDAVEEGLIERDPIGKAIIKGKKAESKKIQDFNQLKLHKRLSDLDLGQKLNRERFILLVAKTGMRFSEVLATAPQNLNFSKQYHSVNKTMDDKGKSGFLPTKNQSSVRRIRIDWRPLFNFQHW
ncbi:MAG: hypothetical protein PUK05_04345 [Peptoniphilaceae bacterium]|nr:hypothetical protein [Peptoniphilaceae bacterium]MDY5765621.1 hypothetical protein [Peptoniphilaceae bacterium]